MANKKKFMEWIESNRKILGWLTAVLVFIGTLFATFHTIATFLKSDTTQEYRQIVLDSSSGMISDFIPGKKSKWDAAKEAIEKILSNYEPRIQNLALRQFGGRCDISGQPELQLKFGEHSTEEIQSVLRKTKLLKGEGTLIQALWKAIADFDEAGRLSLEKENKDKLFNTITVIAGNSEFCNPGDTLRLKKRLKDLDFQLEFQIIAMGFDKQEIEKITKLAKSFSASVIIIEAEDEADLDRALQNPNLANLFSQGRSYWRAGNDAEAIPVLKQAADEGLPEAMILLGHIQADITKQDHTDDHDKTAVEWYRKGADAGNAIAMTRLGIMYMENRGVSNTPEENHEIAVQWFEKAVKLDPDNQEAKTYLRTAGK